MAWMDGKPHKAWEIIQAADRSLWPGFQRGMLDHARDRYRVRMGL